MHNFAVVIDDRSARRSLDAIFWYGTTWLWTCFLLWFRNRALWLFEYITPSSHFREEIKMVSASGEVKLRWDLSTDDILKKTEELIERSKKVYDAIGALKPHQLTFDNCLKVLLLCLKNWFSPCIHTLCSRVCMCKSFNVICQAACTVQGASAFIILFDHSS